MKLRNKKTGKIYRNAVIESYLCAEGYKLLVKTNKDASFGKHYDSLSALNEDWEDVKEPLIKDEQIRKAVRAWFSLFDVEKDLSTWENSGKYIQIDIREFIVLCKDGSLSYSLELPFRDKEPSLRERFGLKDYYYTIEELCGSEE